MDITKDDSARVLPDEEAVRETTEKTRAAMERLVSGKQSAAQPTAVAKQSTDVSFIRYTPIEQRGLAYNSGASQRIIRLTSVQVDPLEPPRFKTNKKLPGGPPSPPAPVLHSPPRKVTAQEQSEWTIPPCISNWKNAKGYTIPLDKRLAADGRGLQDVHINDGFAKLTEALYIAERESREAIELRAKIREKAANKEREMQEQKLRELAQKAREERAGIRPAAEEEDEVRERDEVRRERARERERERRIQAAAPDRRNKLMRDRERDVSERVALGLPAASQ